MCRSAVIPKMVNLAQEKSPAYLSHADIHENGDMSVGGEGALVHF